MGRPDPSAREIMGNRQAGQHYPLCLHNERLDGVRGHPQMCSGDGILSGCLNKASPSPVLSSLCHLCLPHSLSFMPLVYFIFFLLSFSSPSCFDVRRAGRLGKPEEPVKCSRSLLYDTEQSPSEVFVELLPSVKEKRNLSFEAPKLFSPVECIKVKAS